MYVKQFVQFLLIVINKLEFNTQKYDIEKFGMHMLCNKILFRVFPRRLKRFSFFYLLAM